MGAAIRRNVFVAPVLGSEIWTPKRGPALGLFLVVSAYPFVRRRVQACWSKRPRITFFDAGPSWATT